MEEHKKRGRPPKPKPSEESTLGESLEDISDGLRALTKALDDVYERVRKAKLAAKLHEKS